MHVQRIFQGWSVTHSRISVTCESYARICKIILLPSSQRPARTQIESRAFVEDLRTLQQPDIVRESLTFDRHAFAMFQIVDDPRQIRGSGIVVDEIVLHTLEGIAVTHHFACGYVFVEDLPYDILDIHGFRIKILIFQRFRKPSIGEILLENLRLRLLGKSKILTHAEIFAER